MRGTEGSVGIRVPQSWDLEWAAAFGSRAPSLLRSPVVPESRRFQLTEVCLVSQPHAVSGGGGFLISKPGLQQDRTTQTSQNDVTNWGPSVPKPERDVSY